MQDTNAVYGYYRFPALAEDWIVFVAENDLWKVSLEGGVAERLTATPGIISHPKISPDQKWIAYSATDEGSADIFVIPSSGGEAKRLTFHSSPATMVGWHPDNETIFFRSNFEAAHTREQEIYQISRHGGLWQKLPIGHATSIDLAADGETCVLQRGYADPAIWRGYQGGRCGSIWYGNLKNAEFINLSREQQADCLPFLYKKRIFFLSDRGRAGNLYSYQVDGSDLQQHTFHHEFYLRWPNHRDGKVVYQVAGEIYLYDIAKNHESKITIRLTSCGTATRARFANPVRNLHNFTLSPKREESLAISRGRLYLYPNWKGAVRPIGKSQGVRYRLARWLPEGESFVVISDASQEEKIEMYSRQGELLKSYSPAITGYIQQLLPSPTGDELLYVINSQAYLVNMKSWQERKIEEVKHRSFKDFCWSSDGNWLAYSKYEKDFASLFLYSLEQQKIIRLTGPEAHDFCPCFDPDGKYLYFLSNRTLNPYADSLQLDYSFPATTKPYLITLQDNYSPFSVMAQIPAEESEEKDEEPDNKEPSLVIDLEDISDRIQEFPVKEGRYVKISAVKNKVILLRKPLLGKKSEPSLWEDADRPIRKLSVYDLVDHKEENISEKVTSFSHRAGAKEMVLKVGKKLRVVRAGESLPKQNEDGYNKKSGWLDLSRIKIHIDPEQEWHQMFYDAWRWHRDFYWAEDLKGIDWNKIRDKYAQLLPRLRSRNELSDLLWELSGELGTSHAYVLMEEPLEIARYRVGLLGVDLQLDEQTGLYRFSHIYRGNLAQEKHHSPLAQPGVKVKVGDYLLAINGIPLKAPRQPNELLLNLAGTEVMLTISVSPDQAQAKEHITITTLASDTPARYYEWVHNNRQYVEEKTQGQIGYIHVPDMGMEGMAVFHRDFLWQYHKDGLIVDVRHNGGGHISPILLARLQRKALAFCKPRHGEVKVYPTQSMRGPIVVLCDEHTGSDGDIFCQAFKMMQLGTVIGTRTWGGVVGIIPDKRLIDGGIVTQPEFAFWFQEKGWDIESQGVQPDIVVQNDPASIARGEDLQMDRAIAEITRQLEQHDLSVPEL